MAHDTYKDVLIENDELRKHIWQATDENDKILNGWQLAADALNPGDAQ